MYTYVQHCITKFATSQWLKTWGTLGDFRSNSFLMDSSRPTLQATKLRCDRPGILALSLTKQRPRFLHQG